MFQMVMLFGMNILLVILVEGSNYYCIRSKAQLFLRLKVTSMQERQLSHLMDSMPDKFLISTLAHEARAPKSIYSNKQMNTFFGCDMVKAHINESEAQKEETNTRIRTKKSQLKPRAKKKLAMNKKIFSEFDTEAQQRLSTAEQRQRK